MSSVVMTQKNPPITSSIANHKSLIAWRSEQVALLDQASAPTRHHDNWRAFPWRRFKSSDYTMRDLNNQQPLNQIEKEAGFHYLVFVDGVFDAEWSDPLSSPEGAFIGPWSRAIEDERAQRILMQSPSQTGLYPLENNLCFTDGLFCFVPAGVVLEKPIKILAVSTGAGDSMQIHLRHDLILSPDAKADVCIESISEETSRDTLVNQQVVVDVQERAELNIVHCQNAPSQKILSHMTVIQSDSSVCAYQYMGIRAQWARESIQVSVNGEQTKTYLRGLMLPTDDAHFSVHTVLEHEKVNTFAKQDFRSVIADRGQTNYEGRVHVKSGAVQTVSTQHHDSLLLSNQGQARSCPQLEIYADDVRCNHGATVGELDENQLFYLQSRGIEPSAAKALLLKGFIEEIVRAQSNPVLQSALMKWSAEYQERSKYACCG